VGENDGYDVGMRDKVGANVAVGNVDGGIEGTVVGGDEGNSEKLLGGFEIGDIKIGRINKEDKSNDDRDSICSAFFKP
jgi:hypothetical protein